MIFLHTKPLFPNPKYLNCVSMICLRCISLKTTGMNVSTFIPPNYEQNKIVFAKILVNICHKSDPFYIYFKEFKCLVIGSVFFVVNQHENTMELEISDLNEISLKNQSFFDEKMLQLQDSTSLNISTMADDLSTFSTTEIDANPFSISAPSVTPPQSESLESYIYIDEYSENYKMDHKHRGKAVVLNHSKYLGDDADRPGTNCDVDLLKQTLELLKFDVHVHNDLTNQGVRDLITELVRENHSENDCIAVFVLSHGKAGSMIASYDAYYPIETIWRPFTADNCKTLAGKPKLFFFQVCRGSNLDCGVPARKLSGGRTELDSGSFSYKLPTHADFLLAFSTADEFVSFRDTEAGSWYIQTLCRIFKNHYKQYDLLKMLTTVSREVALNFVSNGVVSGCTQIPNFSSMLMRDVYFK